MSDERPKRLYYVGEGFFPGVPRRDLDERDIARLPDRRLAEITAKHPKSGKAAYRRTKPSPGKAGQEDE